VPALEANHLPLTSLSRAHSVRLKHQALSASPTINKASGPPLVITASSEAEREPNGEVVAIGNLDQNRLPNGLAGFEGLLCLEDEVHFIPHNPICCAELAYLHMYVRITAINPHPGHRLGHKPRYTGVPQG
jgi:hypothetical protein